MLLAASCAGLTQATPWQYGQIPVRPFASPASMEAA